MEKKTKQRRVNVELPEAIVHQMKIQSAVQKLTIRQFVMSAVLCALGKGKMDESKPGDRA
jgi:TPP-dependent 2-oxoacid decarboxylase